MMNKKQKKVQYEQALKYIKFRLGMRQKDFDDTAKQFNEMIANGSGVNNIYMLDTIRKLNWLYTDIAAHHDALRALNIEF